ncbi:MAG: hypothetical protein HQK60_06295 [Deltaproteobacteria bacterium]|nr:hypothetical protein [Deltaproteobacteria bacterium]
MEERYLREIESGFPYPIISSFIRLRTDEYLDPGPQRLRCILATAEAICRFLGLVVLCECRDFCEASGNTPTPIFHEFRRHFERPTWGTWATYLREGLKYLHDHRVTITISELYGFYFGSLSVKSDPATALRKLQDIRNGLAHDKINCVTTSDYKNLCRDSYPLLEEVLEGSRFLLNYELIFVRQIEVNKKRREEPIFLHRISQITGKANPFSGGRKSLEFYMDSQAVILTDQAHRRCMNLTPLLIYADEAVKAPDIFFYNGLDDHHVPAYFACYHNDKIDRPDNELMGELQNIIGLFTTKTRRGKTDD